MSHAQYDPTLQTPPPRPTRVAEQGRGNSRLLPILGVAFGLLGLTAGVAAWFRAAPAEVAESPAYSQQQVADAKEAICSAYKRSWRSAQVAGSKKNSDPEAELPVVAVNGRVAEVAVGNYLLNSADANPAAPTELKTLVRQLGFAYQNIVLTQLADGTKVDVSPIGDEADKAKLQIDQICQ